ncbi:MAG: hypothetical protein VCD00_04875 [Candidatus Hydrogenedentota bacterium]
MGQIPATSKIIIGILIVLSLIYLWFGHLENERETELARLAGTDRQTQILMTELDEYRILNGNQQRGILIAGGVIVLVASIGWIRQSDHQSGADSE